MNTDNFTEAAQIIDQHRIEKRWVGDGVRIECHCGHESSARWDPAAGPIDAENNTHRVADRLHAVHVADMLAAQEPTSEGLSSPVAAAHNRAVSRSIGARGLFQ